MHKFMFGLYHHSPFIQEHLVPEDTDIPVEFLDLNDAIGRSQHNIFFLETDKEVTHFHPRLLCAFESAAMHNPELRVGDNTASA